MINFKNIGVTEKLLFFSIIIISIFGLTLLYSATNQDIDIVIRQGARLLFCFILMMIIGLIDINKIKIIAPYLYLACIVLLMFTIFWGHDSKGAKRWIIFFGFSLQVSEIIKVVLPIFLAWFLSLSEDKEIDLKKLLLSFIIIFLPIAFIIKQPDLGTSLIVLLCGLICLFLGGVTVLII